MAKPSRPMNDPLASNPHRAKAASKIAVRVGVAEAVGADVTAAVMAVSPVRLAKATKPIKTKAPMDQSRLQAAMRCLTAHPRQHPAMKTKHLGASVASSAPLKKRRCRGPAVKMLVTLNRALNPSAMHGQSRSPGYAL